MSIKPKKKQDPTEDDIVLLATRAAEITEELFGADARADEDLVDDVDILLEDAINNGEQESDLIEGLKRMREHAKKVFNTTFPKPKQVIWVFNRVFPADE